MKLATLLDFWPAMTIVTCLAVFGISIDITQNQTWLPLLALIVANAILVFQIVLSDRLWRMIMGLNETTQHDEEKL